MIKIPHAAPVILVVATACGGKRDAPPASSDPGSATPDVGSAKPPVDAAAAIPPHRGEPEALSPKCIPTPDHIDRVMFARIGGQLVACADDAACWNIDGKTGAVSKRDVAPLPGIGHPFKGRCHHGLCPADGEDGDAGLVALHPDGKRAAMLVGDRITVFDLATKKITSSFAFEISNAANEMWFVGDRIFIRGNDAGPASYLDQFRIDGAKAAEPIGIYQGGVAVSDDKLVVQEDGVDTVSVFDGVRPPVRYGPRKVPAAPCKVDEVAEWRRESVDDSDPKAVQCFEYIKLHYLPYEGAQVFSSGVDGKSFIGVTREAVFTLDAKLVETSRVKLAQCPKPPE